MVVGNQVQIVRGFCYHGSHVEADGGNDGPEVRRRVAVTRDCMNSLQRGIWKTGIRIGTKLRLFKVYILPILLFGAETWTLTRVLESKLDVFQRMVSKGDPGGPLLCPCYVCGHLPACGSGPGLRDGSEPKACRRAKASLEARAFRRAKPSPRRTLRLGRRPTVQLQSTLTAAFSKHTRSHTYS